MRIYTWTNRLYLNDKQIGLQSLHVLGEMIALYANHPFGSQGHEKFQQVVDWAANHKTAIFYSGTNSATLRHLWQTIGTAPYPVGIFHEDEDSLDGALTGIGIILPTRLVEAVQVLLDTGEMPTMWVAGVEVPVVTDPKDEELVRLCANSRFA